jgi:integrase
MSTLTVVSEEHSLEKAPDFVLTNGIAKFEDPHLSEIAHKISFLVRKHRLSYKQFLDVCQRVRKDAGLRREKPLRVLPQLLTEYELRRYWDAVRGNPEHEVMLKLLFYTAVRVAELVNIRVCDVDLGSYQIFINQGKGGKDRRILFPESFRLTLELLINKHPERKYLFENRQFKAYTPRRVQQIVAEYAVKAGIEKRVHPHLFRHQMLTALTRHGISDAKIQLISGHGSKKSLEIYQHLGLEAVEKDYQQAMKSIAV